MQFTCRRRDLYLLLKRIALVVPKRSTLPILQTVLVETSGNSQVQFSATNLELGCIASISAVVDRQGKAALPLRAMVEWLREHLEEDQIQVRNEEHSCLVVDDVVAFRCLDATAYPPVHRPTICCRVVRCPARLFKQIVAQVSFAALSSHPESILSNLWFYVDQSGMTFAAGNKSCATQWVAQGSGFTTTTKGLYLTSARTLRKVARSLSARGSVWLEIDQQKAVFCIRSEDRAFLVRLADSTARPFLGEEHIDQYTQRGERSPFASFFPRRVQSALILSKHDLRAVLSTEKLPVFCTTQEQAGEAQLLLRAYRSQDVKESKLPIHLWGSVGSSFWISSRSLSEALMRPGASDMVVLGLSSQHEPVLFRWMDADGAVRASYSYVFAQLNLYSTLQHAFVRRALPTYAQQFLTDWGEQQIGQGAYWRVREEALFLVVSLLSYGMLPTQTDIQQSLDRLKQMSQQRTQRLADACEQQCEEIAQMLAVGAFAPGGSLLLTPEGPLSLDAESIQAAFVAHTGKAIHPSWPQFDRR